MGIQWGEHYNWLSLMPEDSVQAAAQWGQSQAKTFGLSDFREIWKYQVN